jgi:hypothetical protein
MWPFKRKKRNEEPLHPPFLPSRAGEGRERICPHCGGAEARLITSGAGDGSHIKSWRGERYVTWRCLSCGRDFYTDEPPEGAAGLPVDDRMIEDEDALREAEEELKRRTDEEDDRRYMPGGQR